MSVALVRFEVRPQNVGHFAELFEISKDAAKIRFANFQVWNLKGANLKDKFLNLSHLIVTNDIEHLHIEWIHDSVEYLVPLNELLTRLDITWTGTGSVSHILRGVNRDYSLSKVLRELKPSRVLLGIFTWDNLLVEEAPAGYPRLLDLKDYQNISVNKRIELDCCSWREDNPRPVLGIVGQLFPYRGVSLLINRFIRFPREPILLAGSFPRNNYSWKQLFFLILGKSTGKIFFKPFWLKDTKDLNHLLCHIDALVLDTMQYPQPSGIAARARHFGIPVLINSHDSFLGELSKLDRGILKLDLLNTSPRELKVILDRLKKYPPIKAPNKADQINSFVTGWSQ
jgi:hypothetical protein